jgi:hypothetical protein
MISFLFTKVESISITYSINVWNMMQFTLIFMFQTEIEILPFIKLMTNISQSVKIHLISHKSVIIE